MIPVGELHEKCSKNLFSGQEDTEGFVTKPVLTFVLANNILNLCRSKSFVQHNN